MKKLIYLLLALVFIVNSLQAGDLKFNIMINPSDWYLEENNQDQIVAEYENINLQFAVDNIMFFMNITEKGSSNSLFQNQVQLSKLDPGEKIEIGFGTLNWANFELGKTYTGQIFTEQAFDEDLSNNIGSFEFEVVRPFGDLRFLEFIWPNEEIIRNNNQNDIQVTYSNPHPTNPIRDANIHYYLIDKATNEILDEDIKTLTLLEAGESTTFNFGNIAWSEIQVNSEYTIEVEAKLSLDKDTSNNIGKHTFKAIAPFDRDSARNILLDFINETLDSVKASPMFSTAFLPQEIFESGTFISSFDEEVSFELTLDAYFFYLNLCHYTRFEKDVIYGVINPDNGEITTYDAKWWPVIDGIDYNPNIFEHEDKVFGDAQIDDSKDDIDINISIDQEPADSVCAVFVRGHDANADMNDSFVRDVNWLKWILQQNELGPKLPEGNIQNLGRASKAEIKAAIDKLKENYKKIYFYYSGHGSNDGKMCTRDSAAAWMSYKELLEELYGTEADDFCIVIDACFAGKAIDAAKADTNTKDKNIEIYTSSDSNKESETGYYLDENDNTYGIGLFTRFFSLCSIDSTADENKDGKVDYCEAYDWVIKQAPKTLGRDFDSLQKPQKYVHKKQKDTVPDYDISQIIEKFRDYTLNTYAVDSFFDIMVTIDPKHYKSNEIEIDLNPPDPIALPLPLDGDFFMGIMDPDPLALFERDEKNQIDLILYFPEQDQFFSYSTPWWPLVNGSPYLLDPFESEHQAYSKDLTRIYDSPAPILSETPIDPPQYEDSTCAILVSGRDSRTRMNESFERDVDFMEILLKYTASEKMIRPEDIKKFKGNHKDDIIAAIRAMVGKKKKVYFYYSGHGSSTGSMCMGDTNSTDGWMSYDELFKELNKIGAENLCVIIDACYSGLASAAARDNASSSSGTTTVATGSNATKTARTSYWGNPPVGFGAFSIRLQQCWEDERADIDGVPGVSLKEAFDWIKKEKPQLADGRDLDSLQCPTITIVKKGDDDEEKEDTKIYHDLKITYKFDYGDLDWPIVSTNYIFEKPQLSIRPWMPELSGHRYWTIKLDGNLPDEFNADLEFLLTEDDFDIEIEDEEDFQFGMVYREDSESEWQAQYPSLYNKDERTLTCGNTNHLSDWAFAVIQKEIMSVEIDDYLYNFQSAPNPFKNEFTISFDVDISKIINISIIDQTGRLIDSANERLYAQGTYNLSLDGSKYPAGVYFVKLSSPDGLRTIKVIKEK